MIYVNLADTCRFRQPSANRPPGHPAVIAAQANLPDPESSDRLGQCAPYAFGIRENTLRFSAGMQRNGGIRTEF